MEQKEMRPVMKCKDAQNLILEYREFDHDAFALDLALTGAIEIDDTAIPDEKVQQAAKHISECQQCRPWLEALYPVTFAIEKRIAKYCCSQMFAAVTDPNNETTFSLVPFRDESCWTINGHMEFAKFCPWCGKELPEKPFEDV